MLTKAFSLIVMSLSFVGSYSAIAQAEIIWDSQKTFGNIEKYEQPFYPSSEAYVNSNIAISRSSNVRAFNERQNVTLTRNIKIALPNPAYIEVDGVFANYDELNLSDRNLAYDWDADYDKLPELPEGTIVDSHYITFYKLFSPEKRETVMATITFNTPIIGLIDSRDSDLTNDLFALTDYHSPPNQTLEGLQWTAEAKYSGPDFLETRDYIKITGKNNNVLELRWTSFGYEGLRVLTKSSSINNKDF
ncbi:MAG: hypothetical protein ACK58N_11035 [Synechocystis sp.]|jgi:hypothetical protein